MSDDVRKVSTGNSPIQEGVDLRACGSQRVTLFSSCRAECYCVTHKQMPCNGHNTPLPSPHINSTTHIIIAITIDRKGPPGAHMCGNLDKEAYPPAVKYDLEVRERGERIFCVFV